MAIATSYFLPIKGSTKSEPSLPTGPLLELLNVSIEAIGGDHVVDSLSCSNLKKSEATVA
jgi:hypothetical protein